MEYYHYFVSYTFMLEDGAQGWGMTEYLTSKKISSMSEVFKMRDELKTRLVSAVTELIILDYKLFE